MPTNRPISDITIIACPQCDLLQRLPTLEPGASARCLRCHIGSFFAGKERATGLK